LEAAGYIIRRKEKAAKGRFVTVLEIYDVPQDRGTARGTSAGGTSASATSAAGTSSGSTDRLSTDEEDAGDQHSSALAAARAGEVARENGLAPDLKRLYAAADKLPDDRLRRLLLQLERKRPQVYRQQRQKTLAQLGREDPEALQSVREVDLLSFKYALQHYSQDDKPLPAWLTRFPR
jgi:hypothetical protein